MRCFPIATLLMMLCAAWPARAQDSFEGRDFDVEGATDHPLVSRYDGAVINTYHHLDFDEYVLPLGPTQDGAITESKTVEGEVTRILYYGPEGHSTLQVYRNYERALTKAGFEVLFECKFLECDPENEFEDWFTPAFYQHQSGLNGEAYLVSSSATTSSLRFLTAHKQQAGGGVYVTLHVTTGWWDEDIPATRLDVIEVEAMETDKVFVDADALRDALDATGKVALYNLYFDTGQATLQPASGEALGQIALLLSQNPDLQLHVVGHTDATGGLDGNRTLSERRAEAVVDALVQQHDVSAVRLTPHGVGPLAPVATNRTEEGRARNRRVELVVR